ncbi:MAG: ABC transporter permease [Deltaproteobacteria bacterium]|nr:ABC transporter permease [Deltaproteobacteria bacterium]
MVLGFLINRLWLKGGAGRSVRVMQTMLVTGVALSVAALIVALSVTAGFERDYKKSILDFNAPVVILPDETISLTESEVRKAFADANISGATLTSVTPYLYREGLLIHKGVIKGVVLKGTTSNAQIQTSNKEEGIVLGDALAKNLNITPGEEIKLLIPRGKTVTEKDTKRLKVSGTFKSGLHEFDAGFALLDLSTLQNMFGLPKTFHGFELRLNNPDLAPAVSEALEQNLGPLVSVQNWIDINRPLFEALNMEKWVFRILMGLMVFVSALNLIGAVLLSVFRNKKTIAMLQALGLPPVKIRRLFACQGLALGACGVFLGLIIGTALVWITAKSGWIPLDPEIYFLSKLPVDFDPTTVVIIALFSLFLVWQTSSLAAGRALAIPIREGLHGPG